MRGRSDTSDEACGEKALTTAEVLRCEFEEIWGHPYAPDANYASAIQEQQAAREAYKQASAQKDQTTINAEYVVALKKKQAALDVCYKEAFQKNQAALCLSGGGIRSAAFALGVLQALAQKRLLTDFHYLSTVSGGGYIGGFLTRWIHEEAAKQSAASDLVIDQADQLKAAHAVEEELRKAATAGQAEPAPVQWLREYSNFLTPRTGLASADTWSGAVLWIRNTLINWFVFLPAFLFAVAIPNLYLASLLAVPQGLADGLLIVSFASIAFATYFSARELPSHTRTPANADQVRWRAAIPALVASILLPVALAPYVLYGHRLPGGLKPVEFVLSYLGDTSVTAAAAVLGGAVMAGGLVLGYLGAWLGSRGLGFLRNLHTWIIGAVISGAAVGIGAVVFSSVEWPWPKSLADRYEWRGSIYASLMPLWIVISQLLLTIFYTAFRSIPNNSDAAPSKDQPRLSPDLDREWLARLSAVKLRAAVVGAVFVSLALVGPILFFTYLEELGAWVVGLAGTASGATAVLGGKAASTGDIDASGWRKALTLNRVVILATLVFLALLVVLLSQAESSFAGWLAGWIIVIGNSITQILSWFGSLVPVAAGFASRLASVLSPSAEYLGTPLSRSAAFYMQLTALGIFGVLLFITSKNINVNRFSLNALYRNRLGRAFLGAARGNERDQDPFSQFDPADNARMGKLRYRGAALEGGPRRVLFPVINLALNLVGTERLAWQERKAHSFVVTPLACGSPALGSLRPGETGEAPGAYVETKCYAGRERDDRFRGNGISLATAMAISGAAASPNMGYNSSPATAFLMTLFNVRLGAWLPNPGHPDFDPEEMKRSAPTHALRPFLSELSGQTNDKARDIYLSDGGHFENLGLYEMVRRRCRHIVVIDAGYDPDAYFEDLGNAVRKIMADLDGVEIKFTHLHISSRKDPTDPLMDYALGTIKYAEKECGQLLYIKPSYFRDRASVDVRSYANLHEEFPHESTADQWFSESQFESYRRLGEMSVTSLFKDFRGGGMREFFCHLKGRLPKGNQPTDDPNSSEVCCKATPAPGPEAVTAEKVLPNGPAATSPSTEGLKQP